MPAKEEVTVLQTIKEGDKVLAVFYSDGTVRIDDVQCSYPHVGRKWSKPSPKNPNPKPVYSCSVLMPKTRYRAVKDALVKLNQELMKEAKIDFVKPDAKYMIDGNDTGKEEMKDCYVIRTREDRKPFVKNERNESMSDDDADRDIQGGDWVSILIRPWPQNSADWGKRLNCGITGIRKLRTGERFGEGRIGEEEVSDRFSDVGPDEPNGGFSADEDPDQL